MTEQKGRLQSICELSNHLLYLEPIFSGSSVRDELTQVKANFQKLVLDLFSLLESQVRWRERGGEREREKERERVIEGESEGGRKAREEGGKEMLVVVMHFTCRLRIGRSSCFWR